MGISVRGLEPADAEAAGLARVEGWRHAYRGLVPREFLDGMDAARWAAGLRAGLAKEPPGVSHLVAEVDEHGVVGWACLGPYRPNPQVDGAAEGEGWGELYAVYVRPEFMGAGVGRALLVAALDGLAALGHARVRLWVLAGNARARGFYERHGFTPDGAAATFEISGAVVEEVRYARG